MGGQTLYEKLSNAQKVGEDELQRVREEEFYQLHMGNDKYQRSPLAEQVMDGTTTFEKTITPLVEENLKLTRATYEEGVCNSPEFAQMASEIFKKAKDVLPFEREHGLTSSVPVSPRKIQIAERLILTDKKYDYILGLAIWGFLALIIGWEWLFQGEYHWSGWTALLAFGGGYFMLSSLGAWIFGDDLERQIAERIRDANDMLAFAKFLDAQWILARPAVFERANDYNQYRYGEKTWAKKKQDLGLAF